MGTRLSNIVAHGDRIPKWNAIEPMETPAAGNSDGSRELSVRAKARRQLMLGSGSFSRLWLWVPLAAFAQAPSPGRAETILYVDRTAGGAGNGSSWSDAYTSLQAALAAAEPLGPGTEIWVARGKYVPEPDGSRDSSFHLVDGVRLIGGFRGTETGVEQRDPQRNPTILSGDLYDDDATDCTLDTDCPSSFGGACQQERCVGENAYHVITASDVGSTTVLDGFVVTGGRANGPNNQALGGGLLILRAGPTIENCTFQANWAERGGGVFIDGGAPRFSACEFVENGATLGGAVGIRSGSADPSFEDCVFVRNTASDGGGALHAQTCADGWDCGSPPDVCHHHKCAAGACDVEKHMYGDINYNGAINVFDLFCILDGFEGDFSICSFDQDDIHGSCGPGLSDCCPNGVINIFDLQAVLDVIAGTDPCCSGACCINEQCEAMMKEETCIQQGGEYQGDRLDCGEVSCSPMPLGPLGPMGTMEAMVPEAIATIDITLAAAATSGGPGDLFTVDVFGSGFTALSGYELSVGAAGGSSGTLTLEELGVDTQRGDFVFAGQIPFTALDLAAPRILCVLLSGSVTVTTPVYLGTFVFRASPDADGTFTVSGVPGDGSTGTLAIGEAGEGMTVNLGAGVQITISTP